jgi:putative protease
MKPSGENSAAKVLAIYDEEGTAMESAPHPQQKLTILLDVKAEAYDILRKKE